MRTPLAWRNLSYRGAGTVASATGVGFAILLLFMQLGFYDVCFHASTMLYDLFAFDLALTSPRYIHMRASLTFPRAELVRAGAVPGVAAAGPLWQYTGVWRNPQTWIQKEIFVLGVEPAGSSLGSPRMTAGARRLAKEGTALADERCQRSYGTIRPGITTEVSGRQIHVVDTYRYGAGFVCDGAVIVGEGTLAQISPAHRRADVAVGLVRLAPGADPRAVQAELTRRLGSNVRVWTRAELEANEQRFFVKLRPIGLMFFSGVILALTVGAMILYQVLAAEVSQCLRQYATLRAMGYGAPYLVKTVVQQAAILAVLGYVPAVIVAEFLYVITRWVSYLPMQMTWARRGEVLALSLAFCVVSGLMAGSRALRADPAELF